MQVGDIVSTLVPVDVVGLAAVGTTGGSIEQLFPKRYGNQHRFVGDAKQFVPSGGFFGIGHMFESVSAHHQVERSAGKRQCLGIAQYAVER